MNVSKHDILENKDSIPVQTNKSLRYGTTMTNTYTESHTKKCGMLICMAFIQISFCDNFLLVKL